MASSSELAEYSSPAKRRKVDDDGYEASPGSELDYRNGKQLGDHQPEDLEEALGCDSGFNELSDGLKSASGGSETTNLSATPARTDSTSDDTGCPLDTDEKDEVSSTVSYLSDLSGLSELSGEGEQNHHWRSASTWVQKQMLMGTDPRELLQHLFMESTPIPDQVDDLTLWKIIVNMMSEPPRRQKLRHVNTISDVVKLISSSKKIIVLTGAGVSVSCGIPDFRSKDGIYSRLAQDFPDLPDPQAMFDINYFAQDPRPFFKFAREIYPGQFKPSPCHRFIKMLERQKKLLRNYSQNIDTLEQVAGIENVIECHGSFATASCTRCKYQVKADDIREDIFAQKIPICTKCKANTLPSITEVSLSESFRDLVTQGIMKPDIVFFGEGLPDAFHDAMSKDKDECDLLIVIGSSLKVRPVALIPSSIPSHVPQVLINRESLPHLKFDIELLGDGDIIINHLCHLLEGSFKEVCWQEDVMKEVSQLLPPQINSYDSWEQSQDTIRNPVFSQEISETSLKARNVSSESQNSFIINTASKRVTESSEICISPFHAGHMENADGSFALLNESPKRRLEDSSVENSPKRIRFDNESSEFTSLESENKTSLGQIVPEDSSLKRSEDNLQAEECHVVPSGDVSEKDLVDLGKDESSRANQNNSFIDGEFDSSQDLIGLKPRHVSIDSAMDSGLGDSCNSNDCVDRRIETGERNEDASKVHEVDRHCWQPKTRESLAARLPESSFFQLAPGRYIFPGAEVYSNFEDFDRCSVSANSESSDSESDSSSDEEEMTCVDDDVSDGAEGDAESQLSSQNWPGNFTSDDKH